MKLGQDSSTQSPDPYITELVSAVAKIGSAYAPSAEEEARYEEALDAFAGGVLKELHAEEGTTS